MCESSTNTVENKQSQSTSLTCVLCDLPIDRTSQVSKLYHLSVCQNCKREFVSKRIAAACVDIVFHLVLVNVILIVIFNIFQKYGWQDYMIEKPIMWNGLVPGEWQADDGYETPRVIFEMVWQFIWVWLFGYLLFIFRDGIRGCSLGKYCLGLRVVNLAAERRSGFLNSIFRNLPLVLTVVLLASVMGFIGLIMAAAILLAQIYKGPRIGDYHACTRVVDRKREQAMLAINMRCRHCGHDMSGRRIAYCPECKNEMDGHQKIGVLRERRRLHRKREAMKDTLCMACGYDLRATSRAECPECGEAICKDKQTIIQSTYSNECDTAT